MEHTSTAHTQIKKPWFIFGVLMFGWFAMMLSLGPTPRPSPTSLLSWGFRLRTSPG